MLHGKQLTTTIYILVFITWIRIQIFLRSEAGFWIMLCRGGGGFSTITLRTHFPTASWPILYGNLLYKMGQDFLEIQYVSIIWLVSPLYQTYAFFWVSCLVLTTLLISCWVNTLSLAIIHVFVGTWNTKASAIVYPFCYNFPLFYDVFCIMSTT